MPHIHEKIDFTSEVFIVHKNKVLLRLHEKYKKWLGVGGHVELDEDPVQAAVREAKEEVGLDITIYDNRPEELVKVSGGELIVPQFINRHHVHDTHEHIAFVYFGVSTNDDVIPEKPDDVWKWLTKEELDKMDGLERGIKFYAENALKILGE